MRLLFIIIPLILSQLSIFAQSSYEFNLMGNEDQLPQVISEDPEGNIFCSILGEQNVLIIRLNRFGELTDSLRIKNPDGICDINNLIRINENKLVGLGYYQIDTSFYLWFLKFNSNLDIEQDKKLLTKNISRGYIHSLVNQEGNIISATSYWEYGLYFGICMYELTQEGDTLRTKFFKAKETRKINFVYDILDDTISNNYKIFTTFPFYRLSTITNVTYDFNITGSEILAYAIEDQGTAKWISQGTFVLTGKHYDSGNEDFQMGIVKLNRMAELSLQIPGIII